MLDWLTSQPTEPLDEKWVPGASADERRSLRCLGGIARRLLDGPSDQLPALVHEWLAAAPAPPEPLVAEALGHLRSSAEAWLADLYASLVRSDHRRPLGTFFTPAAEVTAMLDMWDATQPSPAQVIDVGAGVGVFTAAATTRWTAATVSAVDINPVTLGLLAVRMGAPDLVPAGGASGRVTLVCDDFVSWIDGSMPTSTGPRLILGNPPYTRLQLLDPEDRVRLHAAAGDLCGTRASLSSLMTAVALTRLEPTDGLSFLLPAQWLESQYAAPLRAFLWKVTHRRVELRLVESSVFPDARVDAVALMVGVEQTEPQDLVVSTWQSTKPHSVNRADPVPETWRRLFTERPAGTTPALRSAIAVQPSDVLSDVATVRRGVATGNNRFFLIPESSKAQHRLPDSVLRRAIRRLGPVPDVLTSEAWSALDERDRPWLLVANKGDREKLKRLNAYLTHGEETGAGSGELCSRRDDWYDLEHDLFVPDVILSSMGRSGFRVVENQLGALITNNLYGWRWLDHIPQRRRQEIIRWFRSDAGQNALRLVARRQADQLLKLEPGALKNLPIPRTQ